MTDPAGNFLAFTIGQWSIRWAEGGPISCRTPRSGRVLQGWVRAVHCSVPCYSPSPSPLGAKRTFPCAKETLEPLPTPTHIPPQANSLLRKGSDSDRQESEREPTDTELDP